MSQKHLESRVFTIVTATKVEMMNLDLESAKDMAEERKRRAL